MLFAPAQTATEVVPCPEGDNGQVHQMGVDMILGQLADHPHDSPITSANHTNDWSFLFSVSFEVFEASISISSEIVEEDFNEGAI